MCWRRNTAKVRGPQEIGHPGAQLGKTPGLCLDSVRSESKNRPRSQDSVGRKRETECPEGEEPLECGLRVGLGEAVLGVDF